MGNKCCCEDPNYHVHSYCVFTEVTECHRHVIRGVTSPAEDTRDHKHKMEGVTSTDSCHSHCYRCRTGKPKYMCSGHVHEFGDETSRDEGHRHCFCGTTDKGRRCRR
ncbi:YmaF-like protein [Hydrogenispora ethanolica]|jgi:hypothetical protein|uniref:YmaF-like protein n=2 Tax=Hydrogenispora ethanolica TaxID=1082276 RepID=A0A4R1QV66_HYDET|nr:YmaF family protein [Hydrogenispora ethanolica]TCL57856.1 YmaF-like protein [Hydrogenispora ethanolica]